MAPANLVAGDKLRLRVIEPRGHSDARVDHPGNYVPVDYVGSVETIRTRGNTHEISVRWHLPASFGYDTLKGSVSTLLHISDGVYLEARKRPRNVIVSAIEKITEDEFKALANEASLK